MTVSGTRTDALLDEAADHLQAALDLLDEAGTEQVAAARVCHALEDLRERIAEAGRHPAPARGRRMA